jgi:cytochrome c biogenesis protein CcdA
MAKVVFMLIGIGFLGYAAYLRSILEEENVYIIIGVVIVIIGVITFFFGESEEKITQEDDY